MKPIAFRVQMYRSFTDSGWIEINPMTVVVGKNESGKTTLLKALHKFNPFLPEPYTMESEWPRGRRKDRSPEQAVCTVRFCLTDAELEDLAEITDVPLDSAVVEVTKSYSGRFEVHSPNDLFPNRLHPDAIGKICESLPKLPDPVGDAFRQKAEASAEEARRAADEGRFGEFVKLKNEHASAMQQTMSPPEQNPHRQNEQNYLNEYLSKIDQINTRLSIEPSIQKRTHEYVQKRLPTFIYMSDYRAFTGSAQLDQVKSRKDRNQLTEEDKTLLMILNLSGLNLNDEVRKGGEAEREQRQYDLDDASATLTREISERWRQKKYEVQFRADGQLFYTFVKDERDPSLIRLEERSKGFQWFFSFDLMFMHESGGTFEGCVILLDEPGLHLHPDAQRDLLQRMRAYAEDNTLVYTTHLPFMIDLQQPGDVRVLSEAANGPAVTEDLTLGQPEAKFVLQAALGMSGSTSYLVAQRNLVVEGVDDFWFLAELSRLLRAAGMPHLPDDVHVTPSGGASEAVYIATFMIGQKLEVVVLLDSDKAGETAWEKLVKGWLTKYHSTPSHVLRLGECAGASGEFSIEDLFETDYYIDRVTQTYQKQLATAGTGRLALDGHGQLVKQVERAFEALGINFNKGSVAKVIRSELQSMSTADQLAARTREMAAAIFSRIREAFKEDKTAGAADGSSKPARAKRSKASGRGAKEGAEKGGS